MVYFKNSLSKYSKLYNRINPDSRLFPAFALGGFIWVLALLGTCSKLGWDIVGRNHCTHALIVNVRISVSRLYHETHGNYSFPARALVP